MNILPLLFGLLIGQSEGADRQTALRAGLLGALLPMPAGLLVAAIAARPTPQKAAEGGQPALKTVTDARRAVGTEFDAFVKAIEKDRVGAYEGLTEQIKALSLSGGKLESAAAFSSRKRCARSSAWSTTFCRDNI